MQLHVDFTKQATANQQRLRQPAPHQAQSRHRGGLKRRALHRIGVFIDEHLQEPLQLADLAAAARISRFHFARMFRLSTGESPMRYLQRARIDRAKTLLRNGDQAICDIALGLGFYDQSHFTRSFRRIAGLSPTEFVHQQGCARGAMLARLPQHLE